MIAVKELIVPKNEDMQQEAIEVGKYRTDPRLRTIPVNSVLSPGSHAEIQHRKGPTPNGLFVEHLTVVD